MKKIKIPIEIFDFRVSRVSNIFTGLKKLYNSGFTIYLEKKVPKSISDILKNENIKVKVLSEKITLERIISLTYNKMHGNILFERKAYNSLVEFSDEILHKSRSAVHVRNTNETKIRVSLNIDGNGKSKIHTGIGFFNHMLEQIARHSNIDLSIQANGDLWVDEHHTVEDIGITFGEALLKVLNDKKGIQRFGFAVPMDDSMSLCSIDLSGRSHLNFNCKFKREKVGNYPTELVKEFFKGVAQGLKANIFIQAKGENEHHKIESIFKAFAKALNEACRFDERNKGMLPSTKGLI